MIPYRAKASETERRRSRRAYLSGFALAARHVTAMLATDPAGAMTEALLHRQTVLASSAVGEANSAGYRDGLAAAFGLD